MLISYLLVADSASRLLAREQRQADEAQRRAHEVQRLADLGAESLAAGRADAALASMADVIARTLQLDRCEVWAIDVTDGSLRRAALAPTAPGPTAPGPTAPGPTAPGPTAPGPTALAPTDATAYSDPHAESRARAAIGAIGATSPDGAPPLGEHDALDPAARARRIAAAFADAPRDAFVPLYVRQRPVGALRLVRAAGLALDESERTFVDALAHYTALGVERVRLVAEAERAEAVREADRLKDFVLATVSHDLRTPLTTIKALANESARRGDRNALVIEEQADRLSRMVADVLDLSRARAGAFPLAPEINTADDVVGAALRQAGGVLHDRAVVTQLRDDGGLLVGCFDFVATLRILGNLIDNAVKYAPPREPIVLDVVREGDTLAFSVCDRGAGIGADERERVFAPFHRARGVSPDVGGTGLGLAVARALAEAQRGSLDHTSRDGGGSVFTLRVPASDDPLALDLMDDRVAAESP